ncbi:hypothetical protein [Paenibacillus sp. GM2]|uniref:hypothetical protein n=1 Tax=Paenibacillus sp. GM2 TaxID=1622070 RepID=UPI0008394B57|nr:hypothetical protein [Paenibacillus sp. GM2]
MNRKSNSSRGEMLFTMGFLFTLIAAFGTFFLGLQIGVSKTEAKYASIANYDYVLESDGSYQQQDLVTFYFTVFQPYQNFKNNYVSTMDRYHRGAHGDGDAISSQTLKQLRKSAQDQYKEVASYQVSSNSPLLLEAQADILKSLRLFDENIDRSVKQTSVITLAKLSDRPEANDEFLESAVNFGLQAQNKFYASILKWSSKYDKSIPDSFNFNTNATIKEWKTYSFAIKNKAVADIMLKDKMYVNYLPQDMTAKIDQMITSGKASSLNLNSVQSVVKILTETEAIQENEFLKWKPAFYKSESLPELPFFFED